LFFFPTPLHIVVVLEVVLISATIRIWINIEVNKTI
jgi:hypothetical protein